MSRFNLISLALVFVITVFQAEASRCKRSALDNTVSTTIPSSFDYRDHGKVTPIKTQGECGSSYAFAAVAAIESQYLLRKNQSLDLAEQFLLNCDPDSSLCNSDDKVDSIFNYAKSKGIPPESCHPYTSGIDGYVDVKDKCDVCLHQRHKIAGFRQYGIASLEMPLAFSEDKIAKDLYNFGPATVAVYLPSKNGKVSFYDNLNNVLANYTGGIMDLSSEICNANNKELYVFLLIGYTPDYWIAKASLGHNWGEKGYIRFKRGTNFCAFQKRVFAPYLDDSVQPVTKIPQPANQYATAKMFSWQN